MTTLINRVSRGLRHSSRCIDIKQKRTECWSSVFLLPFPFILHDGDTHIQRASCPSVKLLSGKCLYRDLGLYLLDLSTLCQDDNEVDDDTD